MWVFVPCVLWGATSTTRAVRCHSVLEDEAIFCRSFLPARFFTCWFYSDQSQKLTLTSKSYHCNSLLWAFLWEFGQCQLLPPTKDLETKIKNLWFGSMLGKEMPTFVLIFFIHLIPFSTLLSVPATSALNVWFLRAQINSRYKNQCFLQRICGVFLLMQVFVFLFPSQGPLPPPWLSSACSSKLALATQRRSSEELKCAGYVVVWVGSENLGL